MSIMGKPDLVSRPVQFNRSARLPSPVWRFVGAAGCGHAAINAAPFPLRQEVRKRPGCAPEVTQPAESVEPSPA